MQPFAPRTIAFHGIRRAGDWRLKTWSVVAGAEAVDWDAFEGGIALAERELPQPAVSAGRLGVGFLIAHQGRTANYTVLAWWDRENELPLRVFVDTGKRGDGWRPNRADESVCVWDLKILWSERQAWVDSVLREGGGSVEAYLEAAR
jgi:hypothetical protein